MWTGWVENHWQFLEPPLSTFNCKRRSSCPCMWTIHDYGGFSKPPFLNDIARKFGTAEIAEFAETQVGLAHVSSSGSWEGGKAARFECSKIEDIEDRRVRDIRETRNCPKCVRSNLHWMREMAKAGGAWYTGTQATCLESGGWKTSFGGEALVYLNIISWHEVQPVSSVVAFTCGWLRCFVGRVPSDGRSGSPASLGRRSKCL